MDHENSTFCGDALIETLYTHTHVIIKGLKRRWGWGVNSDVWSDVEQEARLALWKAHHRWESLSAAEQEAYAARCVRRAAVRVLRRELKHKRRTLFIEDLSARDQDAVELSCVERCDQPSLSSPQNLLASLDDPLLADAFRALSADEQLTVFLGVILEFSDAEIASTFHTTPAAAKKRRQRALTKMRRFIENVGGGGGSVFESSIMFLQQSPLLRAFNLWGKSPIYLLWRCPLLVV